MTAIIFFVLGLLTGWAIFVKWPSVGGLFSDLFAVAWSWVVFLWEKVTKRS
jgi:hypothetical protein